MVRVDVGRDRRIGAPRDDNLESVRAFGQQSGDAGLAQAGQGPAILVESVNEQHQPASRGGRLRHGLREQAAAQQVTFGKRGELRGCSPVIAASWSSRPSVKAALSAWLARRAVTKNDTTHTSGGGCRTNQDINADLPARAGACHHTYASSPAHQAASSSNSSARSRRSSGDELPALRRRMLGGPARRATRLITAMHPKTAPHGPSIRIDLPLLGHRSMAGADALSCAGLGA
jgi:hypothetical protein